MRYVVEIRNVDGRYRGEVRRHRPPAVTPLPALALGQSDLVRVNGTEYELGEIVRRLIDYKPQDLQGIFSPRGQLDIGRHLYGQVFGGLNLSAQERLRERKVDVRIVTEDEHIARLPWVLLASRETFLSTLGWSVALSVSAEWQDCELPPSPRILMVMPEPEEMPPTQAESHFKELVDLLSAANHLHARGLHLEVAHTWAEFKQQVANFKPHVLYFYGHGMGGIDDSSLMFPHQNPRYHAPEERPLIDVANCLRQLPEGHLRLAYVNCCLGDAGGMLGAGRQLGSFIPAVVTNCTSARVDAARAQGMALLQRMIVKRDPPHEAVAEMRSNLTGMDFSFRDVRWMTPVLHCNYDEWKAKTPQAETGFKRDPHWRSKLDRVKQFGQVAYQTRNMLRGQRPRSLAYVWYGQEGQGIREFHERLKVELQSDLTDVYLYEKTPNWPPEFNEFHRSASGMLTEAFGVRSLEEIPDRIREETRFVAGRQILVSVRHEPILPGMIINTGIYRQYLEWWDFNFVPQLGHRTFALLGVSFVVRKPQTFRRVILERDGLNGIRLNNTVFQLLDEMERLEMKDLLDFLQTHNINLPPPRMSRIIADILDRTGGQYERVLEELKGLEERIWDLRGREAGESAPAEVDDDSYN